MKKIKLLLAALMVAAIIPLMLGFSPSSNAEMGIQPTASGEDFDLTVYRKDGSINTKFTTTQWGENGNLRIQHSYNSGYEPEIEIDIWSANNGPSNDTNDTSFYNLDEYYTVLNIFNSQSLRIYTKTSGGSIVDDFVVRQCSQIIMKYQSKTSSILQLIGTNFSFDFDVNEAYQLFIEPSAVKDFDLTVYRKDGTINTKFTTTQWGENGNLRIQHSYNSGYEPEIEIDIWSANNGPSNDTNDTSFYNWSEYYTVLNIFDGQTLRIYTKTSGGTIVDDFIVRQCSQIIIKYQSTTSSILQILGTNFSFDFDAEEAYQLFIEPTEFTDLAPAISGKTSFATNVNDQRPISYFTNQIKAIDDVDGDISHKIVVEEDGYTPNKAKVGVFTVRLSVTDSANNKSYFNFVISILDQTAPVITGNTSIVEISYTETFNVDNFMSTLTVTDNADPTVKIKIESNNYNSNKTNPGTYTVVYSSTDASSNKTTFTKTIKVVDDVDPVIDGTSSFTKPIGQLVTVTFLRSQLTATDQIDGDLTANIYIVSDNYTGKGNRPGSYQVVFGVKDAANNVAEYTVNIGVADVQGAGWYITNDMTFSMAYGVEMTRSEIVNLLITTNQVQAQSQAAITYVSDTYSDYIGIPGEYKLAFNVVNPNGTEGSYTFNINVLDESPEDVDIIPQTQWEKYRVYVFIGGGALILIFGLGIFLEIRKNNKKTTKKSKK